MCGITGFLLIHSNTGAQGDRDELIARLLTLWQMLLTEHLSGQFLPKVDRATMAAGVEARVPLLDETVAKLAVTLPAIWEVAGREKKIILRESMRDRLPAAILDGRKTGIGTPYGYWLRSGLARFAQERLLDDTTIARFNFDKPKLERCLIHHIDGTEDRGFLLRKLLHLALWNKTA